MDRPGPVPGRGSRGLQRYNRFVPSKLDTVDLAAFEKTAAAAGLEFSTVKTELQEPADALPKP